MRIVRLANYVGPRSGGMRTALRELGAGYLAAGHDLAVHHDFSFHHDLAHREQPANHAESTATEPAAGTIRSATTITAPAPGNSLVLSRAGKA